MSMLWRQGKQWTFRFGSGLTQALCTWPGFPTTAEMEEKRCSSGGGAAIVRVSRFRMPATCGGMQGIPCTAKDSSLWNHEICCILLILSKDEDREG